MKKRKNLFFLTIAGLALLALICLAVLLYVHKNCEKRYSLLLETGESKAFPFGTEDFSWEDDHILIKNGKITGKSPGTSLILQDGLINTYINVTVCQIPEQQVTMNCGSSYVLHSFGPPVRWISTNPTVAQVMPDGTIYSLSCGRAQILGMVRAGGKHKVFSTDLLIYKYPKKKIQLKVNETAAIDWGIKDLPVTYTLDKKIAVIKDHTILPKKAGKTRLVCQAPGRTFTILLKITAPDNIVTKEADLPKTSQVSRIKVTINSYPKKRTYTVFHQSRGNNSSLFPSYMPWHGCAACSLSAVLTGFGIETTPANTIEHIEKEVLEGWYHNYYERRSQMPATLCGISRVLNHYNIKNRYIMTFDDDTVKDDIFAHLKTGNPVIFEVCKYNRYTKEQDTTWSGSYHTLVFLGLTNKGHVIVADPANSNGWNGMARLKYIDFEDILPYMFSCRKMPDSNYFAGKATAGGYILVN